MAKKTIVEKAAEKVGYGMAMAEDLAGSVKAAVSAAVTTLTESPDKGHANKASEKPAKRAVAQRGRKRPFTKPSAKKASAKKTSPAKKTSAKKATKKSVKTSAKKAVKRR